jgi:soluble lytic murein transglycosylase-like protein
VGGVLLLLLLALALPPVREAARSGWRVLREAVQASRREAARKERIEGYAARYRISFALAEAIYRAAEAERLDPELAFRLVRVESAFREDAVSPVGALGLTQLMPATAADLDPGISRERILERDTNLRLGFRYLRILLRVYRGDITEALHAYNRGMGTVERIRAAGGDPANGYAAQVLGASGASPVRGRGPPPSVAEPPTGLHGLAPARLPAEF